MTMQKKATVPHFHSTDENLINYSKNSISKGLEKCILTLDDADLIREFILVVQSTKQISESRAFKLTTALKGWRRFIGPYRDNTYVDVYEAIKTIKSARKENGELFAKNTIADYVRLLKRFYKWMIEEGYSTIDEKKIMKIKSPPYDTMTKTAEMMLTETEVKKIIEVCQNSRDRALISALYEGGFRIGELANLRWGEVKFTKYNAIVNVNFKTNMPRLIPLIMARPYLAQWRNDYPLPVKDDGFVFLSSKTHRQVTYQGLAKQLKILVKRAQLSKDVTFHIFRHTRVTHLSNQGMQESKLKKMIWGNLNTNMLATYSHMTDKDVENEMAEIYGINMESGKTGPQILPQQCVRCAEINTPTASHCAVCGMPLGKDAQFDVDDLRAVLEMIPPKKIAELLSKSVAHADHSTS